MTTLCYVQSLVPFLFRFSSYILRSVSSSLYNCRMVRPTSIWIWGGAKSGKLFFVFDFNIKLAFLQWKKYLAAQDPSYYEGAIPVAFPPCLCIQSSTFLFNYMQCPVNYYKTTPVSSCQWNAHEDFKWMYSNSYL